MQLASVRSCLPLSESQAQRGVRAGRGAARGSKPLVAAAPAKRASRCSRSLGTCSCNAVRVDQGSRAMQPYSLHAHTVARSAPQTSVLATQDAWWSLFWTVHTYCAGPTHCYCQCGPEARNVAYCALQVRGLVPHFYSGLLLGVICASTGARPWWERGKRRKGPLSWLFLYFVTTVDIDDRMGGRFLREKRSKTLVDPKVQPT